MDDQTLRPLADTAAALAVWVIIVITAWFAVALALGLFVGRALTLCSAHESLRKPSARLIVLPPQQICETHRQSSTPNESSALH
ncbi:hypothetical protein KPL76_05710 [Subtercola sp. PAMC28395]|uniref:hypothetical protein n=1 Tax=Subtercola sp. PAMC28395 TaxID=2846775 RepID=UPI001C0B3CB0|nr:hypothetical protein [Subtercola sp. PAMC28395]QWT24855.1 hypothetical protein KPL76_05710 [Subtercola sp. PAMC28395]